MATVAKQFYRADAPAANTSLYVVPEATTAIVTNIIVSSTSSNAETFSIFFDGTAIAEATEIPSKSIATFDIRQVLSPTEVIAGFASSSDIKFHISGVEV
jgi:hypothetical protein